MTVKDFFKTIADSFMEMTIHEYEGNKVLRSTHLNKHECYLSKLPEELYDKEIISIIPFRKSIES